MQIVHIALFVLIALTVALAVAAAITAKRDAEPTQQPPVAFPIAISTVVALVATLVVGYMSLMPEYRLYKASVEKRILVEQANAEADAAVEEARAEVERAKGTAESNKIVDASITEPYLRYLYINSLKNTSNQVIYLPTEAGLPILEAERFNQGK